MSTRSCKNDIIVIIYIMCIIAIKDITCLIYLRLNTLGASVITLDKTQFVDGVALSKRHLFIPAGMITMGRHVQRAHSVDWARETTSPLLPIRHRPTVSSRGRPRPPPTSPPRPVPRRSREGGTRPGGSTHAPPRPPATPRGGWSRPSDDVGRGGPSQARARRRRRRSGRGSKGEPRRG